MQCFWPLLCWAFCWPNVSRNIIRSILSFICINVHIIFGLHLILVMMVINKVDINLLHLEIFFLVFLSIVFILLILFILINHLITLTHLLKNHSCLFELVSYFSWIWSHWLRIHLKGILRWLQFWFCDSSIRNLLAVIFSLA